MSGTRLIRDPQLMLDGYTALLIWQSVLRPWQQTQREGSIHPAVLEFIEQARLLASIHLQQRSASGPISRTVADPAAALSHEPITTRELAEALHVEPRSARRIAARHGIVPLRRDSWRPADVALLLDAC